MNDRRIFLQHLGIAGAGLLLPKNIFSFYDSQTSTILFIDQSGAGTYANVIGVLRSTSTSNSEAIAKALRKKNKYTRVLKYRSTDKFKLAFAKGLIDHFFEDPSLSFYARFVSNKNVAENTAYNVNIKKVVLDAIKGDKSVLLITADRGNYSPSIDFQYLKRDLPMPLDLKYESEKYQLSQLADLFTGYINAGNLKAEGGTVKGELLQYLEKKLKVTKLSDMYNKPGEQKFVVKKS